MGKQEIIVISELLDKASTWRTMFSYSINWGSSFSKPSRVSDHNYKFNQNPAGHDYNGWKQNQLWKCENLLLKLLPPQNQYQNQ